MADTTLSVRDRIRAATLKSRLPKSKQIMFFGELIEIRQPRLADVMKAQDADSREDGVIHTLINNAYVPGTNDRVYEDADIETLKQLPFGGDFVAVAEALQELTSVNFLDGKGASGQEGPST